MLKKYFFLILIFISGCQPVLPPKPGIDFTIPELLNECQMHLDENRLTTSDDEDKNTAFSCYQKVLAVESDNIEAKEGLKIIEGRYKMWAEDALSSGRLSKAEVYLSRLEKVNPYSA